MRKPPGAANFLAAGRFSERGIQDQTQTLFDAPPP
jgi:hypothetical protein